MNQPLIGICGLACGLCPARYSQATAGCAGCSCRHRGAGIQFCWECPQGDSCEIWQKHRQFPGAFGHRQALENNIRFIRRYGTAAFEKAIIVRERLLREMLDRYDEGESAPYLCTAASTLEIGELEAALTLAWEASAGMRRSERAGTLRALLDHMA